MNVLDLFCGAVGGWSHGLHRAGHHTVAACEIDPWRRSVFAEQFPHARMYDDVRELGADRLLADLGYLPNIVVGSPPCQQISAANSQGEGITDDHLFWDFVRIVCEVRPLWCAAENSPRARTSGIDGIIDALGQANYAVWALVVGARHAGANHRRGRLWLIAADAERLDLWQQPGWSGGAHGRRAAGAGEPAPDAVAFGREGVAWGNERGRQAETKFGADGADAGHAAIVTGVRLGRVLGRRGAEPEEIDLSDGDAGCSECGGCHGGGCIGADAGAIAAGQGGTQQCARATNDSDPAGIGCDEGRPRQAPARDRRQSAGRDHADAAEPCGQPAGRRLAQPHAGQAGRRDVRAGAADADGAGREIGPGEPGDDGAQLPPALRDIGLAWPDWNGGLSGLAEACVAAGFGAVDDGRLDGFSAGLRNRAIAALGDSVISQIPEAIGRAMISNTHGA